MFTSNKSRTVIALYDKKIQYLTLARNEYGFYIQKCDSAILEDQVIKNGEVLKADYLKKIVVNIAKKINTRSIDVIVPHDYFLFDLHTIKKEGTLSQKKLIKQYLKKERSNISWSQTHFFEYEVFEAKDSLKVLFRALPREIYLSYEYIFNKAGLKINSVHSEIIAFQDLLPADIRMSQMYVTEKSTYLLEYKNGMYISDKKFNLSYRQLTQDIKKNVDISEEEARKILSNYGVLPTHRDEKVLTRIERSMNPLFDFIKQRKIKEKLSLYVHFNDIPIKGLTNKLKKMFSFDVIDLSALNVRGYDFQDVLTLHKKESYSYEPLIARALSSFTKK